MDTLLVSRLGSDAIAGVGIGVEVVFFIVAILSAVSIGATVLVAGGEPDEVRNAAHALGSPAAMLGAVAVRSTTRALQDCATEGRLGEASALYGAVATATAQTESAMLAYLDSPAL